MLGEKKFAVSVPPFASFWSLKFSTVRRTFLGKISEKIFVFGVGSTIFLTFADVIEHQKSVSLFLFLVDINSGHFRFNSQVCPFPLFSRFRAFSQNAGRNTVVIFLCSLPLLEL